MQSCHLWLLWVGSVIQALHPHSGCPGTLCSLWHQRRPLSTGTASSSSQQVSAAACLPSPAYAIPSAALPSSQAPHVAAGAFVSGQPVLPVLLRYKAKHLNLGWGIVYTPWHFFRMCTQFVNHLEMDILEPYVPSEGVLCSASHSSWLVMGTAPAESACLAVCSSDPGAICMTGCSLLH